MELVKDVPLSSVSINDELLKRAFDICSAPVDRASVFGFPNQHSTLIYDHQFTLIHISTLESEDSDTIKAVPVALATDGLGNIQVLTPKEVTKSLSSDPSQTAAKKRKTQRSKNVPRSTIATIPTTLFPQSTTEDSVLCTNLQKLRLPLAEVNGPFLLLENNGVISLKFGAALVPNQTIVARSQQNIALRFLARALEDESLLDPLAYQASPVDLLRVITRAPSERSDIPDISVQGLRTQLLPYQRESVNWCLRREGKEITESQEVKYLDPSIRDIVVAPPLGWRQPVNSDIWVNPYLLKTLSTEPRNLPQVSDADYKGCGLLAEEMGLGKTLEMISLILLNPRPIPKVEEGEYPKKTHPISNRSVYLSKATLVIVPRTILHQWESEVKLHAPHLKTMIVTNPNPTIEDLMTSDLVLVTYTQLSRWLPHTALKRKRGARTNRAVFQVDEFGEEEDHHSNQHSTLIDVEFWRVILDEVQMVHTGVSAAAQVARRIPRVHAWAASGTPVKHSLEDLRGITYFLDLFPFVERPCWQRLISSPVDFPRTMELVAMRHTKSMVADQLYIPKQHRRLILLKFSAVERARYQRLLNEFLEDSRNSNCNLSLWLLRLRQACSHAVAAGGSNTNFPNGLGSSVGSDIVALTLDQVLAQLVEEADLEVWVEQREKFNLQLQLGQLYDISYEMPKALKEWGSVVNQISSQLEGEEPRIAKYIAEAKFQQERVDELEKKLGAKREEDSESDSDEDADDKLKEESSTVANYEPELLNDEELRIQKLHDDATLFDARRALTIANNRVKSVKLRCKSLRELLHRAYFFLGTGYFRSSKRLRLKLTAEEYSKPEIQEEVKDNFSKETKFYELAEKLRGDLLNEAAERVNELAGKSRILNFMNVHRVCPLPKAEVADKLSNFATELFDKLRDILSQPLLEETIKQQAMPEKAENGDDEEYAQNENDAYSKTLDLQEYAFVYLEILQIILRDRAANINGGNIQPRPPAAATESGDKGLATELLDRREDIVSTLHYDRVPLASIMKSTGVSETLISRLKSEIKSCQSQYASLGDLYNSRVEYYRQLQDLSDQVTDIDVGNRTDYDRLTLAKIRDMNQVEHKIQEKLKNQTYLRNLEGFNHGATQQRSEDNSSSMEKNEFINDESKCTICLETISDGALTPCGHFFCEDCLLSWLSTRYRCPLCNRRVNVNEVHKFRSGESQLNGKIDLNSEESQAFNEESPESNNGERDSDDTHARDLYIPISNKFYNKIHRTQIPRMYGIKIDMIVRHAMYLRSQDPSAQIVVFSQWGTMLKVLKTAFSESRVLAASIKDSETDINAFRTNPDVACLLLHAKADVAGLTLVNANHVFLCEPLMNTALELQAVSRINRIGQTRETTVWQFCVEDTVEQTILGMTTKTRLLQTTVDGGEEPDESHTMEEASTTGMLVDRKSGAEIIGDSEQLRRILFKTRSSPIA